MKLFFTILCSFLFSITFSQDLVKDSVGKYKPVAYPSSFSSSLDEVYTSINEWNGKMDVYFQPNEKNPTPIIINIHGGGW